MNKSLTLLLILNTEDVTPIPTDSTQPKEWKKGKEALSSFYGVISIFSSLHLFLYFILSSQIEVEFLINYMRCCSLNSEHIYLVAILINIVLDFVCAICQVLVAKSLVSG